MGDNMILLICRKIALQMYRDVCEHCIMVDVSVIIIGLDIENINAVTLYDSK